MGINLSATYFRLVVIYIYPILLLLIIYLSKYFYSICFVR